MARVHLAVGIGVGQAIEGDLAGFLAGVRLFRRPFGGARVAVVAHQERVLLDLGLDIFVEFDVRQLQKLDRLLELRRDDEALPLSQIKACVERH